MRKLFKIFAFIFIVFIVVAVCFIFCMMVSVSGYSLDVSKLKNKSIKVDYYDKNGEIFYTDNLGYKGDFISIDKLNKNTINAFVSIEDKRFFNHNGIDYVRILGATLSNIKSASYKEGGSTISQQLIKNTHLSSEKTLKRKFAEIKITKQLEKRFTKNQILEKYLNTIYFGNGAYGINNASKVYFNKTADKLTLSEACLLAGIIKAPSKYSPFDNYENSKSRKDLVLKTMLNNGFIDKTTYLSAIDKDVEVIKSTDNKVYSPYVLGVKSELEKILSVNPYILNKNVKIYTFLDKDIQKEISELTVLNCPKTDKSQIIINSKNNGIIAFYTNNSILKRNPASCVKPWLVYAPMINDKVITESTVITDEAIDFNGYSPKNYGGKFYGNVTVKTALANSLNVPAVKLLSGYTLEKANNYTNKMNVNLLNCDLTCALGGIKNGMTLNELCDCYSPFANNGIYNNSAFIDKVYIENSLIYNYKPNNVSVFSPGTAFIINDILKEGVKSGTSKNLNVFDFDICAKTGTNGTKNGNTDAYSISYTPNHIIGVWLGNIDGSNMPNTITGGTYPTIYNREMVKILYKNNKPDTFTIPSRVIKANIDEETLLKEQKTYLSNTGTDYYYIKGTEPKEFLIENISDNIKKLKNKITLNDGLVEIFIPDINYKKLKIVRSYKHNKKTIYNGIYKSKINDKLYDFGEYEYTLYLTDSANKIHVFKLPKVNYTKKSLSILDNDWWKE